MTFFRLGSADEMGGRAVDGMYGTRKGGGAGKQ